MSNFGFDPFDTFKQLSLQMEKQMNDSFKVWSSNKEFLGFTKVMSDIQARYVEQFGKSQERFLEELNMPTKSDIKSVASLAIQTEEKIDALEEQVWELQDAISGVKEELFEIAKVSKQLATTDRQLKNEVSKLRKVQEIAEEAIIGPSEVGELREEIAALKTLILKQAELSGSKENKKLVAVGKSN